MLLVARAVQGMGEALLVAVSLPLITAEFGKRSGGAIGMWTAALGVGAAAGPILGGVLTQYLGWPSIFWIALPFTAVAAILALLFVRESVDENASKRFDLSGSVLIGLGLAAFVYALMEMANQGIASPVILAGFALSAVFVAGFVVVERRTSSPLVPLAELKDRTYVGAIAVGFFVTFIVGPILLVLTLQFQQNEGRSPLETGLLFLPLLGLGVIVGPVSGRLTDKIGPRAPVAVAMTVLAVAVGGLAILNNASWLVLVFLLGGIGIGYGAVTAPASTAAMNAVDERKAGVASGGLQLARQGGTVVGIAVATMIMASVQQRGLDSLLGNHPAFGADYQTELKGLLAGSPSARHNLQTFDSDQAAELTAEAAQLFELAIDTTLWALAACGVVAVIVAVTMIRNKTADD